MSRYQRCLPALTRESSYADSDDVNTMNEDDIMQREFNNDLLSQAISYLAAEGDDDSPAVYIDRVSYIDVRLLQQLPTQGSSYDTKLYRRVRSMVRAVQREYEDAVDTSPDLIGDDDDVPELHLSSPVEALFKTGDPEDEPLATPTTVRVQTRKQFRYGGPGNTFEGWHKNSPSSLPFPETLRMQDWESMRIDFDLAYSADSKITEPIMTNVPYEHQTLARHDSLGHYESGSRFELPEIDEGDMAMLGKVGSGEKLQGAVTSFNEEKGNNYAPRVFLEKLPLHSDQGGDPTSPSSIRRSLNDSPSKRSQGSSSLPSGSASSNSTASTSNTSMLQLSNPRAMMLKALGSSGSSNASRASPAARRIRQVVDAALAEGSSSPLPQQSQSLPAASRVSSSSARPTKITKPTTPPSKKAPARRRRAVSEDPTYKPKGSPASSPEPSPEPSPTLPTPSSSKTSTKRKRAVSQDPTYKPDKRTRLDGDSSSDEGGAVSFSIPTPKTSGASEGKGTGSVKKRMRPASAS